MPQTVTPPVVDNQTEQRTLLLPLWRVLLHNDDHNSFDHVIISLLNTVTSLTPEDAVAITYEAHASGVALVIVTPKERAEFYSERLREHGLTSTIEPDERP